MSVNDDHAFRVTVVDRQHAGKCLYYYYSVLSIINGK